MSEQGITLIEAVNLALDRALSDDPDVVLLGEDIGTNGGVFRATEGLKEKHGLKRVLDTPLAEATIAGCAVGMATQRLKPVAEIQFMGFIFPALEQLICHGARMRNRTRGRLSCPLVLRAPFGGGIHAPEHHSESTEALLAHIPGLTVVIPSSPQRAYGLLLGAIRHPDPVVFLEPKRIYRASRQQVEDNGEALPLGRCYTLREGSDLTLVTWGALVRECQQACHQLAEQGVSIELIDAVTLAPLDRATLIASVRKTGRLLVVHEACRSFGGGAEIIASISESCFAELKAPPQRLTGYDISMPYFRREGLALIEQDDIEQTVLALMEAV